jgi:hypothetical protein
MKAQNPSAVVGVTKPASRKKRVAFSIAAAVPAVLAVVLVVFLLSWLRATLDQKSCKTHMRRVTEVARKLERYRSQVGTYPIAASSEELKVHLQIDSQATLLDDSGLLYISSGPAYQLVYVPTGVGSVSRSAFTFVVRDGKWTSWPERVSLEFVHDLDEWILARESARVHYGGGPTYNDPMNPAVDPVTRRA